MNIFRKDNNKEIKVSFRKTLLKTGFPILTLKNNNIKLNFILDTGATASLINTSILPKINNNEVKNSNDVISGLDPTIQYSARRYLIPLKLDNKEFNVSFCAMNLDSTFKDLNQENGVNVHGLLGSDFFKIHKCNLDYDKMIVCFKP